MGIFILSAGVYAAAVVESTLGDLLAMGRVEPVLVLATAAVWTVVADRRWTIAPAALIGLVADLTAGGRIGIGMGSCLAAAWAMAAIRQHLVMRGLALRLGSIWILTTWLATTTMIGDWICRGPEGALVATAGAALAASAYTAALCVPVVMLVGWVEEVRLGPERARRSA